MPQKWLPCPLQDRVVLVTGAVVVVVETPVVVVVVVVDMETPVVVVVVVVETPVVVVVVDVEVSPEPTTHLSPRMQPYLLQLHW